MLANIGEVLDCQHVTLHLSDLCRDRLLIGKSAGIEPYWEERILGGHHNEINAVLAQGFASLHSMDEPCVISRHLAPEYVEASPYIQQCWKPQGIVDGATYFLTHTSARFSALGLGRHERQGMFTERELEIAGLLLPHIRRAVTISNVLDARTIERSRMVEALDGLRCAVILSDERGALLHANRAAEEMLRAGSLVTVRAGVLHARSGSAAAELRAAIVQAARNEADIGKTGLAARLTEQDITPIFAHVLPMTGSGLAPACNPLPLPQSSSARRPTRTMPPTS